MKTTRIIAAVAFAAITILTINADAQSTAATVANTATTAVQQDANQRVVGQVQTQVQVIPEAVILPPPPAPKLGFTGQIVYGLGMRVLTVNYGSPAQRAGLEYGDIIMSANGMPIRHQGDLSRALINAVQFNNGAVSLYVKNIRGTAWQGNEYVNVTAHLFGQPIPTAQQVSAN